jgi:hypothetical protein
MLPSFVYNDWNFGAEEWEQLVEKHIAGGSRIVGRWAKAHYAAFVMSM